MSKNSEFDVIDHYFKRHYDVNQGVIVPSGDDGAIVRVPAGHDLVVSTDSMVLGTHFTSKTPAVDVGHKLLAINLSDIAAMGATPLWASVGLTLPDVNKTWLAGWCEGFFKLADEYQVAVIGGDLTRGPLCMTVTIHGAVKPQQAMLRTRASPGDLIFITGTLGDAAVAYQQLTVPSDHQPYFNQALNRPNPLVKFGQQLALISRCCIDISDGLVQDLSHLCKASQVGAQLNIHQLPVSPLLKATIENKLISQWAATSGEDYQLCFTLHKNQQQKLYAIAKRNDIDVTQIGTINDSQRITDENNNALTLAGWDHFP